MSLQLRQLGRLLLQQARMVIVVVTPVADVFAGQHLLGNTRIRVV